MPKKSLTIDYATSCTPKTLEEIKTNGKIVTILEGFGEVDTNHLGQCTESEGGRKLTAMEIRNQEFRSLDGADVLIAECSCKCELLPRIIQRALDHGIIVIALYSKGAQAPLSRMISEDDQIWHIQYQDLADLKNQLVETWPGILVALDQIVDLKRTA